MNNKPDRPEQTKDTRLIKCSYLRTTENKSNAYRDTFKWKEVNFNTKDFILGISKKCVWSSFTFSGNRSKDNCNGFTDMIVLDVDDGTPPNEFITCNEINTSYIILPTTSWTSNKPKYRVILFLSESYYFTEHEYKLILSKFKHIDKACIDRSRYWYQDNLNEEKIIFMRDNSNLELPEWNTEDIKSEVYSLKGLEDTIKYLNKVESKKYNSFDGFSGFNSIEEWYNSNAPSVKKYKELRVMIEGFRYKNIVSIIGMLNTLGFDQISVKQFLLGENGLQGEYNHNHIDKIIKSTFKK